jgi:hypothetical protein
LLRPLGPAALPPALFQGGQIMNKTISRLLLALLLVASIAQADDRKASVDFKASAGYQHDSNVSISELDTNTGEADNALLLELGIDGKVPVSDALTLKAGYGYSQTTYSNFSEFDTAIHQLHADLAYRVGGFDTGLALRHFAATLDGDRFLDIRQVSPSIARLFGNTLYLRGAFTDSKKLYADRPERDADNSAVDFDAYVLLDGMKRYIAFGYRLDDETATDSELDYAGRRLKLAYAQQLNALQLKAQVSLENRDYRNVMESLGEARRDERLRAGLSAALPLSEHFSLNGEAQYADYASNLASASFDEMIYNVSLAASF